MPLHVYYDTRMAPVTFDFAVFLVNAEVYRQSIGVTSSYVYIVAPGFREKTERDTITELEEKEWRVRHILRPLPNLIPSVYRVSVLSDTFNQISYPVFPAAYPPPPGHDVAVPYLPNTMEKLHGAGHDVQPFSATPYAKHLVRSVTMGHEYVTITLRTSKFQPERNSSLRNWYEVYKELTRQGLKVWVLPDFEDIFASREAYKFDWPIAHFAVSDLDLRLALYEDAKDNLFVSNGIGAILTFSKCPFKMFKVCNEAFTATNKKYFAKQWNIGPGESPAFFQENQKWLWLDDDVQDIMGELAV